MASEVRLFFAECEGVQMWRSWRLPTKTTFVDIVAAPLFALNLVLQ
jgi:hypothetical protein